LTIEEFKTPFEIRLSKENRRVKHGESMPWDTPAKTCYRSMSSDTGASAIDARVATGSMIIKHKLKLDDREAIETIRENIYMQYFPGMSEDKYEDVFDRSLFKTLRYRLGAEKFDVMNLIRFGKEFMFSFLKEV